MLPEWLVWLRSHVANTVTGDGGEKRWKLKRSNSMLPLGIYYVVCDAVHGIKSSFLILPHTTSSTVAAAANWIFPHTCVCHDIIFIPHRMLPISSDRGNVWNSLLDYFYTHMASLHNKDMMLAKGEKNKNVVKKTRLSFEGCQAKPMNGKCAQKSNVALTMKSWMLGLFAGNSLRNLHTCELLKFSQNSSFCVCICQRCLRKRMGKLKVESVTWRIRRDLEILSHRMLSSLVHVSLENLWNFQRNCGLCSENKSHYCCRVWYFLLWNSFHILCERFSRGFVFCVLYISL